MNHSILYRILLVCVRRIVSYANLNAHVISQRLQVLLEDVMTCAVAATPITEQQKRSGIGIVLSAMLAPPKVETIAGEFGRIATGANTDEAFVLGDIIDAMRNGNAFGQRHPVVVIDLYGFRVVGRTRSIELVN